MGLVLLQCSPAHLMESEFVACDFLPQPDRTHKLIGIEEKKREEENLKWKS